MISTILHLIDLIFLIGICSSGFYLLMFAIGSLKNQDLRYPQSDPSTRFLVLIPEGSSFDEQNYPAELYRVEYYTDIVSSVQLSDISEVDMFVVLGEVTHVSKNLLTDIDHAYHGNARAIQLNHIVEGKTSVFEHTAAVREGMHYAVMGQGHNRMNCPSSINRVDYAIEARWLKKNLFSPKVNIENRLLHQGVFIHFLPYAKVYSNHPRIIKHDKNSFKRLFTVLPTALAEGNTHYADKLVRNVFPGWQTQLRATFVWTLICCCLQISMAVKWFVLLFIYMTLVAIVAPDYLVMSKKDRKRSKMVHRAKGIA
jgi:hypothetical protein